MRVLLFAFAGVCLILSLIHPVPCLICVALSVFLFIKMPIIAKRKYKNLLVSEDDDAPIEEDDDDEDYDDDDDEPDLGFDLTQRGMQYEKASDENNAVRCYELAVNEHADFPYPYLRLAIIYRKRKQWDDVVRVCDAALAALSGHAGKLCQPEEWEKRKAYAVSKLDTKQD